MKKYILIAFVTITSVAGVASAQSLYENYLTDRDPRSITTNSSVKKSNVAVKRTQQGYQINVDGEDLCQILASSLTYGQTKNFNCADAYVIQVKETTGWFTSKIYDYIKIFDSNGRLIGSSTIDTGKEVTRGGSTTNYKSEWQN
ncbi:MAG: hypothetical protein IT286_02965 [Proteobacteria bacterium]|nr:hypothetical protein [Pseudomonadota bacterium]